MTPQEALKHHVTGAIERREATPIVEQRAKRFFTAGELLRYPNHPLRNACRNGAADSIDVALTVHRLAACRRVQ